MKKIISIFVVLFAVFTFTASCVLADTEATPAGAKSLFSAGSNGEEVMLVGGWAAAEDPAITDEISSMLMQGLDDYQTGMITVSFTPVAYLGSQVVAGINHAILCRAQEINKTPFWTIVYLYEDLQGNVTVLDITGLPIGIHQETTD